jgi:hypothetical protein
MASARCVLTLLLCSSALVAVVNACGFQYPAFLQSDEPILGSAVDDEDTDFNVSFSRIFHSLAFSAPCSSAPP